jgi:hypothetical protein
VIRVSETASVGGCDRDKFGACQRNVLRQKEVDVLKTLMGVGTQSSERQRSKRSVFKLLKP